MRWGGLTVTLVGATLVASACTAGSSGSSDGQTIGTNPYTVAKALRGPLGFSNATDRRVFENWVFNSVPAGQFADSPPVNRGMALLSNTAPGQDSYVSLLAFATPEQAETFTSWFTANGTKARLGDRTVTCGTIVFIGSYLSGNSAGARNLDSALRGRYTCTPAARSAST